MNGYDPYGLEWTDDEATIARIEEFEAACVDGEITADDMEEGDE